MKIERYHFQTLDSTNNFAKLHVDTFNREHLSIVTADQQTAGRGRLGRSWVSPARQNLYATFCFFIDRERRDIGNLPQIMALAAAELLEQLSSVPSQSAFTGERKFSPQLKWPNDLLLQGKKVAGILTETLSCDAPKGVNIAIQQERAAGMLFVAVGVGININMTAEEAILIDRPATSLFIETQRQFVIEELLTELEGRFLRHLQCFLSEGFAPFLKDYQQRLVHRKGEEMSFRDSRQTWKGRFLQVNGDGSLAMQLDDGQVKHFISGELF